VYPRAIDGRDRRDLDRNSVPHISSNARDGVESAQEAEVNKVKDAVINVGQGTRDAGLAVTEAVRDHPIRSTAIGLGVASAALGTTWAVRRRRANGRANGKANGMSTGNGAVRGGDFADRPQSGSGYEDVEKLYVTGTATSKAREIVNEAGERLSRFGQGAARQARRAGKRVVQMYDDNPVAMIASALVIGVVVGALIPRTRREGKLMGKTRNEIVDRAGAVARQARDSFTDSLSTNPNADLDG
jgi:ElaB/YqjD/DUF883 family membrane-anchored ribosome-binding protein